MSFEKSFCPSPWFHMRITNSGTYEYCRWLTGHHLQDNTQNIKTVLPSEYFNHGMAEIRTQLLEGQVLPNCSNCHLQEQHGKVSGRLRQLLKVGVQPKYFEPALASSTFKSAFDYSQENNGLTKELPQDWQIDLGNYCNSQCIMCSPESSSKLAAEFKKLGLIDQLPPRAWIDDPELLEKFCQDLTKARHIQYLHFIGGETVITPGFKRILSALVNHDLAKDVIVGFTTNLTVWDDEVIELLKQFKMVNLGLSVETLTPVNDYIRFPSKLSTTQELLDQWVDLGQKLNWLIQLRITPTCLSIHELTTVYDYAWSKNITIESCNFLDRPEFLRISVLPMDIRQQIAEQIDAWCQARTSSQEQIINTRAPAFAKDHMVQDALSYVDYLLSAPDESYLLPELVNYLKLLESSRNNSVLTYLPQYENILRSSGY